MWEYDKNVLSFVERKKKRIYEFLAALRVTSLLTRRFKGSHFYPLSFHARYARTVHLNPVFLIEASIPATIHVQRALSPLFSRAFALSFEKYFYVQPYLSFTRLGTGSRNSFVDLRFKSRLRGNGAASVSAFFFFFFLADEYIASSSNKSWITTVWRAREVVSRVRWLAFSFPSFLRVTPCRKHFRLNCSFRTLPRRLVKRRISIEAI